VVFGQKSGLVQEKSKRWLRLLVPVVLWWGGAPLSTKRDRALNDWFLYNLMPLKEPDSILLHDKIGFPLTTPPLCYLMAIAFFP
jgi:hypothetical protein